MTKDTLERIKALTHQIGQLQSLLKENEHRLTLDNTSTANGCSAIRNGSGYYLTVVPSSDFATVFPIMQMLADTILRLSNTKVQTYIDILEDELKTLINSQNNDTNN